MRNMRFYGEKPYKAVVVHGGPGAQLKELVAKTDNYNTFNIPTDDSDIIQADGELYGSIWNEAAAMRESGELLEQASRITCPVVAIHGDYDPHPADGVKLPLENRLSLSKK